MKNCNMVLIERLQSSDKIDKYEYLSGKEILPSNEQQIIENLLKNKQKHLQMKENNKLML